MSVPSTPDSTPDHAIPSYYSQVLRDQNASNKFQNLDDPAAFAAFYQNLERPQTRNFVLDFGGESCWAALDVDSEDLLAVLKRPVRLQYIYVSLPRGSANVNSETSGTVNSMDVGFHCTLPVKLT
jgi:hypothetical protein